MVKIGELEVPFDYFSFNQKDKDDIVEQVYEVLYKMIDELANPAIDREELILHIIDSSIITNKESENYEICQILIDLKTKLNEKRD